MTQRRFLFVLLHPGYLRHYGTVVEALVRRGHRVHVAVQRAPAGAAEASLLTSAERAGATWAIAPERPRSDPWRARTRLLRGLADVARFSDPQLADAGAWRRRAVDSIQDAVARAPTGARKRRALARLVSAIGSIRSPRVGQIVVQLLVRLERAVPTSAAIDAFVRGGRYDVVVVSPLVDFASTQVDWLRSAARAQARTVAAIASWDNLTGKGLLRFVPDAVLVWNETQREEAARLHGVPRARIAVTGAQRFDEWFERRPSRPRDAFLRELGLDADRPVVLYLCSSPFIAAEETEFVRRWATLVRSAAAEPVAGAGILVRPHPQHGRQWSGARLGIDNAVVWPPKGAHPDGEEARADYFDSLVHCDAVVGLNTSSLIEAAVLGKPSLTLLDPAFAQTQEHAPHFAYLRAERGGPLRVAATPEEHLRQLDEVLSGAERSSEHLEAFVRAFVRPRGLDRRAADIVVEELEALADRR